MKSLLLSLCLALAVLPQLATAQADAKATPSEFGTPPTIPDGPLAPAVTPALNALESISLSQADWDPSDSTMFDVNKALDDAILKPAADGYRAVTNKHVRGGVSNFLSNLGQPVVLINTVLQGKPGPAFDTASRFMLNTTVGVLGVFDPATGFGFP